MRTINIASNFKAVIKPAKPTLTDNIATNIHRITEYRRAIRRYYQARLAH